MSPDEWLAFARADAERRGLPEMIPVLQSLADAIAHLRAADSDTAAPTRSGIGAPAPQERQ